MKVQISIKFKLLLLTSGLVTAALLANHYLSVEEFKKDKIAYVFDTSLASAQNTAAQIRGDLNFGIDRVRTYLREFSPQSQEFSSAAKSSFTLDQFLAELRVYQLDPDQGRYVLRDQLERSGENEEPWVTEALKQRTLQQDLTLNLDPSRRDRWSLGISVPAEDGGAPTLAFAVFQQGQFLEHFFSPRMQNIYLVDETGDVVIAPARSPHRIEEGLLSSSMQKIFSDLRGNVLVREVNELLVSVNQVGAGNLSAVSIVPKAAALEGLQLITVKSAVFVAVLIAIAIIFSVLGSNQLTANIFRLYDTMKLVTNGHLEARAQVKSQDEIGVLAQGFNHMTAELQRLLSETAEKARMASELQTARTVQSTLFPEPIFENQRVKVHGYYEPASECGGDWWHYYLQDHKLYLWIGDATGHGVPAALITSAARSASSVLECLPDLPTDQAMALMNKAVCETSRGQVMMTFFLGVLDLETGWLKYTSASHDPPYVIPYKETGLKKRDLLPLMDSEGKRLGEGLESQYQQAEIQLNPGDRIFLYTDGVTELVGPDGSQWGERELLKVLLESANAKQSLAESLGAVAQGVETFRKDADLADDVTYFFVEWNRVSGETPMV